MARGIGDIIKDRRIELKKTLEEVGSAVGVSKSTVQRWESGQINNMRRDKIDALAKVLDISPLIFVDHSSPTPTPAPAPVTQELSDHDKNMVAAYNAAPPNAKQVVDLTLEPYMPSSSENEDAYA